MFPNYAELCKQTAVLIWWVVKIIWYIAFAFTMIWCSLEVACMLIILSVWIGLKVYCYISSRQSPVTVTEDICCKATTASADVVPGTSRDKRKCKGRGKGDVPVKVSSSTSRNTSKSSNSRISHNLRCDRPTLVSTENTVPNVSDRKAFETPSFTQQEKTNRPSKKDNQVCNHISTDNPEKSASIETTRQEVCQSIHTSIDRPIATGSTAITSPKKLSSYAVSESLSATSSSSSSSYVVVSGKQDAVMSAAAPRGHSLSSTSAAGEKNPAIMSSVRNSLSACTSSPSNTTASSPKKSVPVAAVRTNANLPACGAVKSRDTSKMAEHKSTAATIAIESTCISATPASGGPTNHDARAKRLDSVDKCAKSDGNVCTSSSPLQSSDNTSSNGQPDCDTSIADTSHSSAPSVASTDTTQTEERARFPLSEEYKFRLVCDICFKPKTEQMTGVGVHGCRQDMLAVKEVGTSQWRWIRQRKPYINFRGDYAMCIKRRDGRPNICYSGCTYAHCDAERRLWNLEKKSAFSISEFITANQTSAPICDVKSLLDKYPVSRMSFSHF